MGSCCDFDILIIPVSAWYLTGVHIVWYFRQKRIESLDVLRFMHGFKNKHDKPDLPMLFPTFPVSHGLRLAQRETSMGWRNVRGTWTSISKPTVRGDSYIRGHSMMDRIGDSPSKFSLPERTHRNSIHNMNPRPRAGLFVKRYIWTLLGIHFYPYQEHMYPLSKG